MRIAVCSGQRQGTEITRPARIRLTGYRLDNAHAGTPSKPYLGAGPSRVSEGSLPSRPITVSSTNFEPLWSVGV